MSRRLGRFDRRAHASRTALISLACALIVVLGPLGAIATSATEAAENFLGGLWTTSTDQVVSGQSFWTTDCLNATNQNSCLIPNGYVYIPTAQLVVGGSVAIDHPIPPPGRNGLTLTDAQTGEATGFLPLPCAPDFLLYSGVGMNVIGACYFANQSSSQIVEIELTDDKIIWNVTAPATGVFAMGFDPADDTLFLLSGQNPSGSTGIYSLVVGSESPTLIYSYQGSWGYWLSPQLAFDARSGDYLVPSAGDGLLAIDPASGKLVANLSLPGTEMAALFDPSSNQIYVSVSEPNVIEVFNAATYAYVATITPPNCFFDGGVCALPNSVGSLVSDPAHGDVDALSILGLLAINTSTNAIVGSVFDYGGGFVYSAAFDPALNGVFGSWPYSSQDIGFLTTLNFSSVQVGEELLWLPISIGVIALSAMVGVVAAVVRYRGPPPRPRGIVFRPDGTFYYREDFEFRDGPGFEW
jgi:hypothetical protein